MDLKFIYTKSDPKFHYTCPSTTTDTFRLQLISASLSIKRVKLYPSIENQMVSKLATSPATFFFRNEYARSFTMRAGDRQCRLPNILSNDYLPKYLYIAFLEEKEYQVVNDLLIMSLYNIMLNVSYYYYYYNRAMLILRIFTFNRLDSSRYM